MSILLLHLTDMHISSGQDAILGRAVPIKQAILATYPSPEACIIIVSGDIANSGKAAEYGVALGFLNDLRSTLQASGIANVAIVVVPGNHDTDLEDEVDVRTDILESVEKYVSKPIDFGGLRYASVISVHSNFFAFESAVTREAPILEKDRLYYTKTFAIGSRSIRFHCFNTAWLSRRKELQSKLYIPPRNTRRSAGAFC